MGTVIVDQFNPVHGYWNKLYEVGSADFDPDAPITIDKYGGPYRVRHIGEPEPEVIKDPVPEIIEDELEGKVEVVVEEEEVEEEDLPEFDNSRW